MEQQSIIFSLLVIRIIGDPLRIQLRETLGSFSIIPIENRRYLLPVGDSVAEPFEVNRRSRASVPQIRGDLEVHWTIPKAEFLELVRDIKETGRHVKMGLKVVREISGADDGEALQLFAVDQDVGDRMTRASKPLKAYKAFDNQFSKIGTLMN